MMNSSNLKQNFVLSPSGSPAFAPLARLKDAIVRGVSGLLVSGGGTSVLTLTMVARCMA